ncbi:hypothetical protein ACWDRR_28365 [Kitasatospora sp. NPDC003701]
MSSGSPWRIGDFRTLFTATALTRPGTDIGYVGLPLIAVTALDASAGQVGALATLGTLAFLVVGLPAGAWVDRMRSSRRPSSRSTCRLPDPPPPRPAGRRSRHRAAHGT